MRRPTKIFFNILIIFYLGIIYFTGVPESNTLNTRIKENAMSVAFAVGIWPSWSMFAPNPIKFDSKSYVKVFYKNGEVKEFDIEKYPTGLLAPFRKARWMKYSQDNLRNPSQRALLKPAIRYFIKKYDIPENPILKVQLKRKWLEVHPFSDHYIHSINKTPRTERNEVLITQKVQR